MLFLVAFRKECATIPAQSTLMAGYHTPIKTRRDSERDGILFWILPPLLLGAVFAFCSMANSDGTEEEDARPAAEASAEEE